MLLRRYSITSGDRRLPFDVITELDFHLKRDTICSSRRDVLDADDSNTHEMQRSCVPDSETNLAKCSSWKTWGHRMKGREDKGVPFKLSHTQGHFIHAFFCLGVSYVHRAHSFLEN